MIRYSIRVTLHRYEDHPMPLTKSVDLQIRNTRGLLSALLILGCLTACGGGGGSGGGTVAPPPPPQTYTIGGSVSGLTASGLVLQDNGGDNLTVAASATSFTFATKVAAAGAYAVTVMTQPANATCTVTGGSGAVGSSDVTAVSIACTNNTTPTFTIGGSVSGLTASGLVLQDNGGDNLTVAASATSFTFATKVAGGGAYAVTVKTQPADETCAVASGSGTVGSSDVTTVKVACTSSATPTFTIGGSIKGLTGSGLILQDNGGGNLTVAANATSFTFPTKVASGLAYAVTVLTPPSSPAQTCTVTGGTGTVGASNVTTVSIACVNTGFTIGGSISGLTGSGLVLQDNGGDNLTVPANATSFTFKTPVLAAANYAVTVLTQPANQTCTVTGGSGIVVNGNVATVSIKCATSYLIGGAISGLNGTGLVLQDNGGDNLTVPAKATTFAFATGLPTGAAYAVTVLTQPSHPTQYCTVTNGSGNVASASISSVAVSCINVGRFAFVTNMTDGLTGNGDVSAYTINPASGVLTPVAGSPFLADQGPTAVAVDTNGLFAYVSNGPSNDVTIFGVDQTAGTLTPLRNVVTSGTTGASIAVSPSDQYIYVGGYGAVNGSISAFANSGSGSLTSVPNSPFSAGNAPYGIAVDPANQLVFATTAFQHYLWVYTIGSDGSLTTVNQYSTGSEPYGVAVYPLGGASGGFVYTADSIANTISAFSYDGSGNLTALTTYAAGNTQPEGIAIDPQGQYLYVANFADNNVTTFSIDSQSGALTQMGTVLTGYINNNNPGPIAVIVDPSGQFVYVVNNADGSVSLFSASAGVLTLVNTYAAGAGATAIAIE
jgi:6-phosphogluconolactonase (cycloisomerase 2 family)